MSQLIALRQQAVVHAPASAAAPHAPCYARHVPEGTLLYALVQTHCPDLLEWLAHGDRAVPALVREKFDEYLRCGVLDHAFLRGCLEGDDESALLSEWAAGNDSMDALRGTSMPRKRTECPLCGFNSSSAMTDRFWP